MGADQESQLRRPAAGPAEPVAHAAARARCRRQGCRHRGQRRRGMAAAGAPRPVPAASRRRAAPGWRARPLGQAVIAWRLRNVARSACSRARSRLQAGQPARWRSSSAACAASSSPSSAGCTSSSHLLTGHGLLLRQLVPIAQQQLPARAGEARHHRADRDLRDLGDLPVGQLLELAQHQDLAELRRQPRHQAIDQSPCPRSRSSAPPGPRPATGTSSSGGRAVLALEGAERHDVGAALPLAPGQHGVAHDPQEPRPRVLARESSRRTARRARSPPARRRPPRPGRASASARDCRPASRCGSTTASKRCAGSVLDQGPVPSTVVDHGAIPAGAANYSHRRRLTQRPRRRGPGIIRVGRRYCTPWSDMRDQRSDAA